MPPQLSELEAILRQMISEHRKLLAAMEEHASAMKAFDLPGMDESARRQESARLRISMLEPRRRALAAALGKAANLPGEPTLKKLAAVYPIRSAALLQIRQEFKELLEQVSVRAKVSGKVASAVLGHLNTVVRLVAGVVERAGLYTKNGVPRVSSRIGAMEAVG